MCDYEFIRYRVHMACFACRKMFRERDGRDSSPRGSQLSCPDCRRPMAAMGWDFAPPRRRDARAWRAVEMLVRGGLHFGINGSSAAERPRHPRDVPDFLREALAFRRSKGEVLAERFAARRRGQPNAARLGARR